MALCFAVSAYAQTPAKVTVADQLFEPDGTFTQGTITITSAQTFTSSDNFVVPIGQRVVVTLSGTGTFSVGLVPNAGTTPSGTYYTADYYTTTKRFTETWVIPGSGPVRLINIRTSPIPSPSIAIPFAQLTPPAGCPSNNFAQWTGTTWTCSASSGGGAVIQTNSVSNASQATLDFQTGATVNGLTITPSNPSGGVEKFALSGTLNDAGLTSSYAGIVTCGAHQFVNVTSRNAAPGCAQPAYSDLTGTPQLAQTLANAAHKWFNSYSSVTGLFTQTQPDYSDLTSLPQLAVTKTAVASNWLRSYDSTTGLFTASQPAYSDITGTPSLFYQTLQNASGVDQTQRGKVEFTGTAVASVTDDSANNRTVVTLTASAGSGVTLQTNGVNDSSQTALNLKSSAATNGLTLTQTNTSGGDVQLGLSGILTVPGGGTGLATLAAHQLYVGNGTSSPVAIPSAGAGKVLIDNGSSVDPSFQDPVISYNNGTAVTAAWTSATTVDTAATAALTSPNMAMVAVTLRATSTMTGGTLNFEADDGSGNFSFPVACDRLDSATVENSFALAVTNKVWYCNIAGLSNFRVRLNPVITGSGTANVRITATTAPMPSEVTVSQAVSGALHATIDSAPTTAITAASLPLPAGASTSAKQPALGTAGSASADVITVQGIASMTPLKVDGSAVTQPVSLASTTITGTVAATQSGTWNDRIQDGAGNGLTTNSSTFTAKFGLDSNLLGTLGTAFSTPGKVDVKGADGDVFVRQTTGSNLHMVCDSGCSAVSGVTVSGPDAPGITPSLNPVQFGATDDISGAVQRGSLSLRAPYAYDQGLVVRDVADQQVLMAMNAIVAALTKQKAPLGSYVPTLPVSPQPIPVLTNSNPCINNVPGDAPVSQTATSLVVSGRPGMRILVCHERLVASALETTSEIEGTGASCGTGTVVHSGSSTAANGEGLPANGGYETSVPFYLFPGNSYCIQQAGSSRVSGKVSYLYVP